MKLPKGFNFGGGMGNIMAEAKNAMERAKNLDNELAAERITVEQNGVTCVYDGRGMLVSLKIDKSLVDPDDVESLEDVVTGCVRAGFEKATALREERVEAITGGLDLGGLGL